MCATEPNRLAAAFNVQRMQFVVSFDWR